MPSRRRQPEGAFQRQVAAYLDATLQHPAIWTHIPSGGKRDAKTAALLKASGAKAGWPDCLIVYEIDDRTCVLGIELKVGKGRMSDAQEDIQEAFWDCHANYVVCRTLKEVNTALLAHAVPTRGRIAA